MACDLDNDGFTQREIDFLDNSEIMNDSLRYLGDPLANYCNSEICQQIKQAAAQKKAHLTQILTEGESNEQWQVVGNRNSLRNSRKFCQEALSNLNVVVSIIDKFLGKLRE